MARKQVVKHTEYDAGPRVPCAYIACTKPAIAKVKVSTNAWSNYCHEHYIEHFNRRAGAPRSNHQRSM
jgi:hypothetical protein